MRYYEDEKYILFPLAFNIFYRDLMKNKRNISFAKDFVLTDGLLDEIKDLISERCNKKIFVIDMDRVTYPSKMLEELNDVTQKVIFYNFNQNLIKEKLREDLNKLSWAEDDSICILNGTISDDIIKARELCFVDMYKKLYAEILADIKDPCKRGEPLLLDSSGLYSNMYINVKKLFLNPESYYMVLYGMATEMQNFGEFDGFISSSKNGAVLASLLGTMLGKKVVHIQGVGPKYSMRVGNVQHQIKKGKTYVYVFDFICTGTELKLVSALINANDASMVGGIGFAKYSAEKRKKKEAIGKIRYLISTCEADIPYKIAGCKEDIITLMG